MKIKEKKNVSKSTSGIKSVKKIKVINRHTTSNQRQFNVQTVDQRVSMLVQWEYKYK